MFLTTEALRSRPFFLFSEHSIPAIYQAELNAQCRRDILARQNSMLLFNPGIVLLVAISSLIEAPDPLKFNLLVVLGICLSLSMLYRIYALNRFGAVIDEPLQSEMFHLHAGLASNSIVWGVFLALSILPTSLSENFALVYIGAIGLSAGAVVSLALKTSLVHVFIFGMTLPAA